MKNSGKGFTIQKIICDEYNLDVDEKQRKCFEKGYDCEYSEKAKNIVEKIFKEIEERPIKYATGKRDKENKPISYNFKLESGKTLSIRTNKTNSKISPRVVGQAGYKVLNEYFGDYVDSDIKTKKDIKKLILQKIHKILPIFLDEFFNSDYLVWVNEADKVEIIKRGDSPDIIFKKKDLKFTKSTLKSWNNNNTLKCRGISIASIQVPKDSRTFNFRFIMKNIYKWQNEENNTNETLGITAEKVICDIFSLERENHIDKRSNKVIENEIRGAIINAFKNIPKAKLHTGPLKGKRGGTSKCSYDFILDNNKTLSVKTNYGKMVCPPEVGQPGNKTFLYYFGEVMKISEINNEIFKEKVFQHIDILIDEYFKHLLDSDYLLWIFKKKEEYDFKVINSKDYRNFRFDKGEFTFTRENASLWNSSNTVKYKGISLGEFEVHSNRNSYKFRFNMKNLLKIVTNIR